MINFRSSDNHYGIAVCCFLLSTATACFGQSFSLCAEATTLYLPASPWQRGAAAGLLWADTSRHWLMQAEYGQLEGSSVYKEKGYALHDRTKVISMRIAHGLAHKGPHTLYLGTRLDLFQAERTLSGIELGWVGSSDASGEVMALSLLWKWHFSSLGSLHAFVDAGYLHVRSGGIVFKGIQDRPLESSFLMAFGVGGSIAFL